jgi:hypothetical protein
LWLTVYGQLKLFPLQAIHEMPLLIKDHQVSLYQLGVDAKDVVRLLCWLGWVLRPTLNAERYQNEKRQESLIT